MAWTTRSCQACDEPAQQLSEDGLCFECLENGRDVAEEERDRLLKSVEELSDWRELQAENKRLQAGLESNNRINDQHLEAGRKQLAEARADNESLRHQLTLVAEQERHRAQAEASAAIDRLLAQCEAWRLAAEALAEYAAISNPTGCMVEIHEQDRVRAVASLRVARKLDEKRE